MRSHNFGVYMDGLVTAASWAPKSTAPFGDSTLCIKSPYGIRMSFDRSCSYFGFTSIGNTITRVPGLSIVARDADDQVIDRLTTEPYPPQGNWNHVAESAEFIGIQARTSRIKTIEIVPQPPLERGDVVYGQIDNITFKRRQTKQVKHAWSRRNEVITPVVRWSQYLKDPRRCPTAEFIAYAPFERTRKIIERFGREDLLKYYLLRLYYHNYDPLIARPLFEFTAEDIIAAGKATLWPIELQPRIEDYNTAQTELCESVQGRVARGVLVLGENLVGFHPRTFELATIRTRSERLYCFQGNTPTRFKVFSLDRGGAYYSGFYRVSLGWGRPDAGTGRVVPVGIRLPLLEMSEQNVGTWIASHASLPPWAEACITEEFAKTFKVDEVPPDEDPPVVLDPG